jgi:citrate/tricarballylate utilization protein
LDGSRDGGRQIMQASKAIEGARRAAEICNACRYCEGYCVVFEVMELRRAFTNADLGYLANLCHNCRNCYYACQYAPPHEFAINLPLSFSEIRAETYECYAWPRSLANVFHRNGVVVAAVVTSAIATTFILIMMLQSREVFLRPHLGPGAFYAIVPWTSTVLLAAITLGSSLVSIGMSVRNFWIDTGRVPNANVSRAFCTAFTDILTLRNLGGGGHGCNDRDESFSSARRYLHHAIFYGFLLCCASTTVAFFYDHILNWRAPYPLMSIPVAFGAAGGISMIAGAAGYAVMKLTGDRNRVASSLLGMDYASLILLLLLAGSGLLLLVLRDTAAMAMLLAIHLGVVLSFFLLLPYSRFIHAAYRAAALLRAAIERGAAK